MTPGQREPCLKKQSVFWPPHMHTCVHVHQQTKDRPENEFSICIVKGASLWFFFWNKGVYETMVGDHKNSREDTAAGIIMAIVQREHRMICYQILLWGLRVRVNHSGQHNLKGRCVTGQDPKIRERSCLKWISLEMSKEACGPGSPSRKLSAVNRPQKGLGISLLLPKPILRWFWVTTQTHVKPYWPSLFHISEFSSLGFFVPVLLCPQCLSCPEKKEELTSLLLYMSST